MVDFGFMELGLLDEDLTKMMEEIDWEHMFDDAKFTEETLDFFVAVQPSSAPAPNAGDSWICEVERLLMKDDDENYHNQNSNSVDDCFAISDILLNSPAEETIEKNFPAPSNLDSSADSNSSANANANASLTDDDKQSPSFDYKAGDDAAILEVDDSKEDDIDVDPLSKKRKRQLRNRDAAMRSRERKKVYVKDLEMKSRYLESECRRLGRLLQCCYAENQMLRITLQSGSTFSMAKLESAVLLLESLLSGSLVWFMALMCLLPLPRLTLPSQGAVAMRSKDRKDLGSATQRRRETTNSEMWLSLSFMRSKRCRASRTRMKWNFTCPIAFL